MKTNYAIRMLGGAVLGVLCAGLMLGSTPALAQTSLLSTQYFDNTNGQNYVYEFNPTVQSVANQQIVCDMFYVFDAHEEMQACCGCPITNNGLRWQNVATNLTNNPQTIPPPVTGLIKKVTTTMNQPSGLYSPCNPASLSSEDLIFPTPAWISHIERVTLPSSTVNRATEHDFEIAPLSAAEITSLAATCAFLHTNGTGRGLCSCGGGDSVAPSSGAGRR